eukprot:TRINITY_DN853_c0_g1_i2.p1 TRINITY_DN853_c0_g1~~TRINITY_DN853_c0_g1_i2.p1  ORF type:complete len:328 (+),score=73.40 TRINITY_DN853_c0_g1_i2:38-1021(+)
MRIGFNVFVIFVCVIAQIIAKKRNEKAQRWTLEIVNTFKHDSNAFTQGLYWEEEEGVLYEGTGLEGRSSLRKVDLNGTVIKRHNLTYRHFGEGIARFKDKIFQLTWRNHIVLVYDREFNYITEYHWPKEGWGLTHDGTNLIISDGSEFIYFVDPNTFDIVRAINVRDGERSIKNLNELEYIDGEIWSNIWYSTEIAKIDPTTGKVNALIDCKDLGVHNKGGDVLNGIAYDQKGKRIFVTGKLWEKLFEIKVFPVGQTQPSPLQSSSSSPASTPTPVTSSSGSSTAIIILFVIGGVLLILLFMWKKRKTRVIVDVATLLKNLDRSRSS